MMLNILRQHSPIGLLLILLIVIAAPGCSESDDDDHAAPETGDDDDAGDDDDNDDRPPPESEVTGLFDLTESLGFYSLPFPIDLRLTEEGTLRIWDFPNPRSSEMLASYLTVGERDVKGFGANSGIFFTFTGALDPASLPQDIDQSIMEDAAVYLVSLDPDAPDYQQRYPFRVKFTDRPTVYGPANLLVLLPVQGVPMLQGHTYAAVVTTQVTDADDSPLAANASFQEVLSGNSGDQKAEAVFAPLVAYFEDVDTDLKSIAVATVFTTMTPLDRMLALRDHVYALSLPGIDPQSLSLVRTTDRYHFLSAEVTIPIYQEGAPPYLLLGGAISFDDRGRPVVQNLYPTRLALTIPLVQRPSDGWPLLIFSHGSGGSWTSFIDKGTAAWLAHRGIAAVSIDAPHHGPRNPISDNSGFESFCFYNALNPNSFRDNNVQAAVELMAVLRQVKELQVPVGQPGIEQDLHFDPDQIYFMGHSQGSTVGPLIVAVDPNIRAAYFSGAGGSLLWNLMTKQRPFPILPIVEFALHLTADEADFELDEFHPVLNLLQHMAEMVDPVSFNPYFFHQQIPGVAPKHIFQAQGITDTYVGLPCHGAFAAAARLDLIEPLLDQDAWNRLSLTGGVILADQGVSGNRLSWDQTDITAGFVQYPAPPGGEDGHYVTYNFPSLQRRLGCFFETAIADDIPTIVEAYDDAFAPCVMQ